MINTLSSRQVFLWAQAVAFKVLITIVPILILATGILGMVLRRAEPFEQVAAIIQEFLPPGQSGQIITFLEQLQAAGSVITYVGILGLLFSAVTIFTTLRVVIANIFQEEWHRQRSIIKGYLFDIRMAAQVGLFFLLTIGASVLLQSATLDFLGLELVWLEEGWRRLIQFISLLIPYLLTTAMFFQLFYFIPKPKPPRQSALLGAVVTGLLWELAKSSFAIYASSIARPERFGGGQEGFPLGNTFALIILFVFWIYYSGVVLIIGGIIAVLHEKRRRQRRTHLPDDRERGAVNEGLPPDTVTDAGRDTLSDSGK
ncbi:MAG: YihY/virulence factor BrkB family protein [Bacteroidota bacterium]